MASTIIPSSSSTSPILKPINRVAILCHILPFLADEVADAIYYASVSSAFRDAIQNYASVMWIQIWQRVLHVVTVCYGNNLREKSSLGISIINSIDKYDLLTKFYRIFGGLGGDHHHNRHHYRHFHQNKKNFLGQANNSSEDVSSSFDSSSSASLSSSHALWVIRALHHQGNADFNTFIHPSLGSPLNIAISRFASVSTCRVLIEECHADPNFCGFPSRFIDQNNDDENSSSISSSNLLLSSPHISTAPLFRSPLFEAVSHHSPQSDQIVEVLLKNGADMKLLNVETFPHGIFENSSSSSSNGNNKSNRNKIRKILMRSESSTTSSASASNDLTSNQSAVITTAKQFLLYPKETTIFIRACLSSSISVVKSLLHACPADALDELVNERPVTNFVKSLASNSSSSSEIERNGKTALEELIDRCYERDAEMIWLILSVSPVAINLPSCSSAVTPIMRACRVRNLVAVRELLKTKQVNLKKTCKNGMNVLLCLLSEISEATESNSTAIVTRCDTYVPRNIRSNNNNDNDNDNAGDDDEEDGNKDDKNESRNLRQRRSTEVFPHRIFHFSVSAFERDDDDDDQELEALLRDDEVGDDDHDNQDNENVENDGGENKVKSHQRRIRKGGELDEKFMFVTEDELCADIMKRLIRYYYYRSVLMSPSSPKDLSREEARAIVAKNFIGFTQKRTKTGHDNVDGNRNDDDTDYDNKNENHDDASAVITQQQPLQHQEGRTTLMYAVFGGYFKCSDILLRFFSSISSSSLSSSSPLVPSFSCCCPILDFLLKKDAREKTAMMYCSNMLAYINGVHSGGGGARSGVSLQAALQRVRKENRQKIMSLLFEYAKKYSSSSSVVE